MTQTIPALHQFLIAEAKKAIEERPEGKDDIIMRNLYMLIKIQNDMITLYREEITLLKQIARGYQGKQKGNKEYKNIKIEDTI